MAGEHENAKCSVPLSYLTLMAELQKEGLVSLLYGWEDWGPETFKVSSKWWNKEDLERMQRSQPRCGWLVADVEEWRCGPQPGFAGYCSRCLTSGHGRLPTALTEHHCQGSRSLPTSAICSSPPPHPTVLHEAFHAVSLRFPDRAGGSLLLLAPIMLSFSIYLFLFWIILMPRLLKEKQWSGSVG